MHRISWMALALVLPVLSACNGDRSTSDASSSASGEPPAAVRQAAHGIEEAQLRGAVRFLGSDLLEGRAPASAGDRLTRAYLATELERCGFEPAASDGSWEQPFGIVGITSEVPDRWTFRTSGGERTLKVWDDFIAWSARQQARVELRDAELVFVGYGIQAPEYDWDDFAGADLEGKVLVILNNDPHWDDDLFAGSRRLYYGRWDYKYETAAKQGAAGAIVIHTRESAGYPWGVVQNSWTGEQFELPAGDGPRLSIAAWTTETAMSELLAAGGHDLAALVESAREREFRPVPLGVRTSLQIRTSMREVQSANVLAKLPGSDPALADQAVIYTAHHDHLGMSPGDAGGDEDRIYNGALDNGAGMAQVLAIACAFGELDPAPRRSIWVAFVGAEEQGLLGSKFFAANPPIAPGLMAANMNFDGGNIWGRALDVALIGHGKSDLDEVATRWAEKQGRRVVPEAFPDRGLFYRSDQFSLAKIGVPALYFDTGVRFEGRPESWGAEQIEAWEDEHYHQPSDELIDDWNFDGMVEDARLGFLAGWDVAQRQALPRWMPGDEFEATRLEALEAAGL